jgi:hypothetical protein
MLGRDSLSRGVTIEGSSLFDSAEKAIQACARLWWFDPYAELMVQVAGKEWRVTLARLRQWRSPLHAHP